MRFWILTFSLWASLLVAETSLYDTPLEDLLNLQVSTASKQVESFEHSAAIVDVLSRKDIEAFGAVTLAELLERMTSVYATGNLPFPQGMLALRGDVTAEQNNHVLVLLNGRPMRDSIFSGLNQDLYTAFPVQTLKQVEVVRGPGSVLYGTNAFVGVINLITRDDSADLVETSLRYGSFDTKQVQAFFSRTVGEVALHGGFSYSHNRGWDFVANDWDTASSTSTRRSMLAYTRTTSGLVTGKWKNFKLNLYGDISEVPFLSADSSNPSWSLSGSKKISRVTADLGYETQFQEHWKASFNGTYNHLAATNRFTGSTSPGVSDDLLLEWTNYLSLSSSWKALLGTTYTHHTGAADNLESGRRTIPYYNEGVFSLYGQTTYQIFEPLRILGGAQFIRFSSTDPSVVPRAAITYALSQQVGFKALYSKAFRAPSQAERNLILIEPTRVVGIGNPGLQPETISTIDLQAYYQSENRKIAATYFFSRQANLIHPITRSGFPVYNNTGDERSQGIEIEGSYLPHARWNLRGSITYQHSRNEAGVENDGHTPSLAAKLGASYQGNGYLLGVFNAFHQAPSQVDNGNGDTHHVNPKLLYYNNLSLKVGLVLTELFDWGKFPKTELELYGTNLLHAPVYYPEYVYGTINSFPGRPGRAVYAALTMQL